MRLVNKITVFTIVIFGHLCGSLLGVAKVNEPNDKQGKKVVKVYSSIYQDLELKLYYDNLTPEVMFDSTSTLFNQAISKKTDPPVSLSFNRPYPHPFSSVSHSIIVTGKSDFTIGIEIVDNEEIGIFSFRNVAVGIYRLQLIGLKKTGKWYKLYMEFSGKRVGEISPAYNL